MKYVLNGKKVVFYFQLVLRNLPFGLMFFRYKNEISPVPGFKEYHDLENFIDIHTEMDFDSKLKLICISIIFKQH